MAESNLLCVYTDMSSDVRCFVSDRVRIDRATRVGSSQIFAQADRSHDYDETKPTR